MKLGNAREISKQKHTKKFVQKHTSKFSGTAWKASKYGVISGPYFPAFGLNTEKHGPETTSYLDTFHAVWSSPTLLDFFNLSKNIFANNCSPK